MKDMPLFYRFWTDPLFMLKAEGLMRWDATGIRKDITGAMKFNADAIASAQLPKQEHGTPLEFHEYGCVKPPYTKMWIEYAVPRAAEMWHMDSSRIGHLIETLTKDEAEEFRLAISGDHAKAHWEKHINEIECVILSVDVFLARAGYVYLAGFDFNGLNMQGVRVAAFQATEVESLRGDMRPMWYTLAMLNCKNVETVQVDVEGQKQKDAWHKRTRCPKVKFHTVRISGGGSRRSGSGNIPCSGDSYLPWHSVRGHFARYTEEKPLFGKYVGQFWIPQHARGDAENGVVIKDYEVVP